MPTFIQVNQYMPHPKPSRRTAKTAALAIASLAGIAACQSIAPDQGAAGQVQPNLLTPYLGGYVLTAESRARLSASGTSDGELDRLARIHIVLSDDDLQLEPNGYAHNVLSASDADTDEFVSERPRGRILFRRKDDSATASGFDAFYGKNHYAFVRETDNDPPPWPVAASDSVDRGRLSSALNLLRSGRLRGVHSLLILRHGELVHEEYFNGSTPTHSHQLRSVTKSVASLLAGIAIGRGLLDESDRVIDVLPDYVSTDDSDLKRKMTVRDVLSMRAGLAWKQWGYPDDEHTNHNMVDAKDWIRFVLDLPLAHPPGAAFNYSDGVANLIAAMLDARTGATTAQFARANLFDALGIDSAQWWGSDPDGRVATAWGLKLTSRDLARFGELVNAGGTIDGRTIVSNTYLERALQPISKNIAGRWHYGYFWWMLDVEEPNTRIYAGRGLGNQMLVMIPESDIVIVMTAWNRAQNGQLERFMGDAIVPISLGHRGRLFTLEDAPSSALSEQGLVATFTDATYRLDGGSGYRLDVSFAADGKLMATDREHGTVKDRGTWSLERDLYCRQWSLSAFGDNTRACFHVVRNDGQLDFYDDAGLLSFSLMFPDL